MTELLTAAQMRAIEQAAIDSGAVTGLELMERAGAGVVEAVFEEWPELGQGAHRVVVLCGPGNNGGDGFVVARILRERGWEVEVFLYGDPERLPPDAKINHDRWQEQDRVLSLTNEGFPDANEKHRDLYVDALFGTGLTRPVEGELARILTKLRLAIWPFERSCRETERYVAVDIPSALCSDSGKVLEAADTQLAHFRADLTVSFHMAKLGHFLEDGPDVCGKLVVKGIGLGSQVPQKSFVRLAERPGDIGKADFWRHKYSYGHALILSGGAGRTGAARLAARGALRIGAGVVTLGVPGAAQMEVACQITALMLRRVEDGDGLVEVLKDKRLNAPCLGPGLGLGRARALVPVILGQGGAQPRPTVLDADALSAFAEAPETLFDLLHESCILTPHAGEFARLFPDISEKLNAPATKGPAYSKVDATRAAAARAGCVVLFKGPDTVIAAPDGRCSVNAAVYDRKAPWLATAGSGDVLAGFITGLLARGFSPMRAAETAAWLHVECARSFGPGLIAEDLPEELPKVFRALEL